MRPAVFRRLLAAPLAMLVAVVFASGCDNAGERVIAGTSGIPGEQTTVSTELAAGASLPGVNLAIVSLSGGSRTDGTFQAGDTVKVTFTVKKSDGSNLPLSELSVIAIWAAGPTSNYHHLIPQNQRTATFDLKPTGPKNFNLAADIKARAVKNSDGSYTYAFDAPLPTTYPTPLNDTTKFTTGELSGQALQAGTYTVAMRAYKTYTIEGVSYSDIATTSKDFLLGGATTIEPREVVTTANCNQCHVDLRHHGKTYRDVRVCVTCHGAGAEDRTSTDTGDATPITIEFKSIIHKLHNAAHLPSVLGVSTNADGTRNYAATPTPLKGLGGEIHDFSEVGFPVWPNMSIAMPKNAGYSALTSAQKTTDDTIRKGVTECSKCHGDPDGSGPLTAPAQGDLIYSQPSRRACGSCHDDIVWTQPYTSNGQTMPAQANDSACALCHTNSGNSLDAKTAHVHPLNDSAVSKGANIAITALAGGTGTGGNFQAGDTPQITFTIKDDTGADVAFAALDRIVTVPMVGPTTNRQPVYFCNSFPTVDPWDFAGRLSATSTTNKGTMSKVAPSSIGATETLIVQFSSATAFTVTGSVSGALGAGALPASPSTNPSGSSISGVILTSSAVAQTITVTFSSATAFTVTGSVSGAMGSGTLPNGTSGSNRFVSTDGSVTFNVTVGTTAFASGNNVYLTVYKGAAANPVIFAIVAGRTSFAANDRFYYDVVKAAASYTFNLAMDVLPYELLGAGNGAVGQQLTAANLPVWYGRQSVYERTALVGAATALTAASSAFGRYVDVAALDAALAVSDVAVLDNGVAGKEEYAQVGKIDTTGGLKRVWFKTPLRFAHVLGAAFQEATLTFKQEGVDYTLTPATGTVTSVIAFTAANPVVMSYRANARFGWLRFPGDALQTTYFPPPMDSPDLDETWGEWAGKTYVDGTYTAAIWGAIYVDLAQNSEVQTYRATRVSSRKDFLYGAGTTVGTYNLISSGQNCNQCHTRVMFHGGGYIEAETCLLCHGIAGTEDTAQYSSATAAATPGITVNYRTMLHKIHMGEELANASTYQVGNTKFDEVVFPAMPGKVKHCDKCHGTSTVWKTPGDRSHPTQQTLPARVYRASCGSCHDSASAAAHIDLQTSATGAESCAVCHGTGRAYAVEIVHKNR